MEPVAKKSILVIDDDRCQSLLYRKLLTGEAYVVMLAKNGKEAKEKVEQSDPDLVILDSIMPDMESLEKLLEVLRNHRKRPPILVAGNSGSWQGPRLRAAYSHVLKLSNRIKLRESIEDLLVTR